MKNCIPFDEMRSRCRVALKAHGIKTSTVYDYQRSLAPLISYMEAKGIKSYTSTLGEEFAMTLKYDSGMSCNKRNDVYKVIKLLNFILGEGASPLIRPARIRYEYAEVFRETIERFCKRWKHSGVQATPWPVISMVLVSSRYVWLWKNSRQTLYLVKKSFSFLRTILLVNAVPLYQQ